MMSRELREQLPADQIAAEDEEEIDADPAETMDVAGKRETHDTGVVNDDNDDGEGAEKIETGLARAIREARINGDLAHRFIGAHNLAESRVKQEAGNSLR